MVSQRSAGSVLLFFCAIYKSTVSVADCPVQCVLSYVNNQCHGKRRCRFTVDSDTLNVRCPTGSTKYFGLVYTCGTYVLLQLNFAAISYGWGCKQSVFTGVGAFRCRWILRSFTGSEFGTLAVMRISVDIAAQNAPKLAILNNQKKSPESLLVSSYCFTEFS